VIRTPGTVSRTSVFKMYVSRAGVPELCPSPLYRSSPNRTHCLTKELHLIANYRKCRVEKSGLDD
jgi:hypothetical protein